MLADRDFTSYNGGVFMSWLYYLVIFFASYMVGSIPFAVIVSKSRGVDIFKEGSGTPGATNVCRVLGKKYGAAVFLLDLLKGFVVVFIANHLYPDYPNLSDLLGSIALCGAIVGHSFSIFLRFHGGKSVATSIGGTLALMPTVAILSLIMWYSVFRISRFVSLASLAFALMLPLLSYLFAYSRELIGLSFVIMAVIFLRHIPNLCRLWQGTENRFSPKE